MRTKFFGMMAACAVLTGLFVGCKDKGEVNDPKYVGKEKGYEYVDLGLSVLWATVNVGATKPDEEGIFFAWAETMGGKGHYSEDNYKYYYQDSEAGGFTKYTAAGTERYGEPDNKEVLELMDDAANASWGGKWRMPTWEELWELEGGACTWEWKNKGESGYAMPGYKVTGPSGAFIFLPACGYHSGMAWLDEYTCGYYWSSSMFGSDASGLFFDKKERVDASFRRVYGRSVRPVLPK